MHLEGRSGHEEKTLHSLALTKLGEQPQEVVWPELVEVGELPSPGVVGLIDNDQVKWTIAEKEALWIPGDYGVRDLRLVGPGTKCSCCEPQSLGGWQVRCIANEAEENALVLICDAEVGTRRNGSGLQGVGSWRLSRRVPD